MLFVVIIVVVVIAVVDIVVVAVMMSHCSYRFLTACSCPLCQDCRSCVTRGEGDLTCDREIGALVATGDKCAGLWRGSETSSMTWSDGKGGV